MLNILFYPEDGNSMLFWNDGNDLPDYTESHSRRQKSSGPLIFSDRETIYSFR
jgi:hypothetical protein